MGHKIEDLQAEIEAGVAELVAGEGWQRWLAVAAHFPRYRSGVSVIFKAGE
jgi:hypothetical protein